MDSITSLIVANISDWVCCTVELVDLAGNFALLSREVDFRAIARHIVIIDSSIQCIIHSRCAEAPISIASESISDGHHFQKLWDSIWLNVVSAYLDHHGNTSELSGLPDSFASMRPKRSLMALHDFNDISNR
jgi:hypothetical protein